MLQYEAKDLFQTQHELIDAKIEVSVSKSIDRVVDQISALKNEVHEMNHDLSVRLAAVEERLSMRNEFQKELRGRTIEFAFKAGWLLMTIVVSALVSVSFSYFHLAGSIPPST